MMSQSWSCDSPVNHLVSYRSWMKGANLTAAAVSHTHSNTFCSFTLSLRCRFFLWMLTNKRAQQVLGLLTWFHEKISWQEPVLCSLSNSFVLSFSVSSLWYFNGVLLRELLFRSALVCFYVAGSGDGAGRPLRSPGDVRPCHQTLFSLLSCEDSVLLPYQHLDTQHFGCFSLVSFQKYNF